MKGLKEIAFSFFIGFTGFTVFVLSQRAPDVQRNQNDTAPTQLSDSPSEVAAEANWSLEQISAPEAWKTQTGSSRIVVAVIDTGCDIQHPNLARNIWRNPGESGLDEYGMSRATNGIDDDQNGFIDDYVGWNFTDSSPDVMDEHGHGTHVAGIIGAFKGDGLPLSGVAPHVSLMILKYYSPNTGDNLSNSIQAIRYAVKMGANIINYSGGGLMKSAEEEEALRFAAQNGVLVVAAAGNEGLNSDFFPFYPANYDLPNILSVGAVDRYGQLISHSNHGIHSVDIVAPGKNIYSTLPQGQYGYLSGTSQATAFASGAAALLLAQDPTLEPQEVIRQLTGHGRSVASLKMKTRSGAILNIKQALDGLTVRIAEHPLAQ